MDFTSYFRARGEELLNVNPEHGTTKDGAVYLVTNRSNYKYQNNKFYRFIKSFASFNGQEIFAKKEVSWEEVE